MARPDPAQELAPDATMVEFLAAAVGSDTRRLIITDSPLRVGPGIDVVHDARVATRRLRCDLRTFRPALDAATVDRLRDELAWLGDLLGQVRDAQVLERRIDDHAASLDAASLDRSARATSGGVSQVTDLLAERARFRHTQLVDAMSGDRYRSLVTELTAVADDPPLASRKLGAQPAAPLADRLARKQWKRARRFAASLTPDASEAELHDLRTRLKRARYAAQAVRPLGLGSKRFRRELAALQDRLGDHHDLLVECAFLVAEVDRFDPATAFVAGRLMQDAEHRRREMTEALPDILGRIDRLQFS